MNEASTHEHCGSRSAPTRCKRLQVAGVPAAFYTAAAVTTPSSPSPKRKAAPQRAEGTRALPQTWTWFAVAAPGLAPLVAEELRSIAGVEDVREIEGGVEFRGDLRAGYAANLRSRISTRVLVRLGEVRAREFAELRRRLSRLPFEAFVSDAWPLRVQASARRCRLHHTKALAETLQRAASDRLGVPIELAASSGQADADEVTVTDPALPLGREPFVRLLVRGEHDHFTVSADSSGLLLHRRGARMETGRAPLRETLAAAALKLAGYDGSETLVNAMCGAGTIALEAVDIALGRAPGRMRRFAFETFPCFDLRDLDAVHAASRSEEQTELRAAIHAFDRSAAALEAARRNAERAEAARHLLFGQADVREFEPPSSAGLLIGNPPYGHRLGSAREVHALYRSIGARLHRAWRGHRVALLVPRTVPASTFGLRHARAFPLFNGGLAVKLLVADLERR